MTNREAVDLFGGAEGWGLGARALGWDAESVEIWEPARRTAAAAGFRHVGRDVRQFHAPRGRYDLVIGSPSCKKFSPAGDGAGRRSRDTIIRAVHQISAGFPAENVVGTIDPDAALTLEPLRIILECDPRAVALEQAQSVLPIWEAYADVLRARDYSVWTGVVDAADFGVPQNRKRAVLLARKDRAAISAPEPTHEGRHVSMADALGWSPDDYVISNYGTGGDPKKRGIRYASGPSAAITSKADRNRVVAAEHCHGSGMVTRHGERPGRVPDAPSFTIRANAGGMEPGGFRFRLEDGSTRKLTHAEAAALQTFPPDHPWCGTKTEIGQQIGNAVPPRLAEALLRELR